MPDAQKLKDYIDKYKLEDELSTAVNMAISQDSEDPFWVICADPRVDSLL